jgi:hypothetical protein
MAKLGEPIHRRFVALLERATKEGWGYHECIIHAARLCKLAGVDPEYASELMEEAGNNVERRPQQPGEVRRVVNWIYSNEAEFRAYEIPKEGAKVEPKLITEFAKGGSIKDLMNRSTPIPQTAPDVLRELYEPDSLLHLSPHHCQPRDVKSCSEWCEGDLSDRQYICPAHLKSRDMGRCNANVDFRHYIVWESDREGLASNWDAQSGVISKLAESLPLKMVCFSGNKSLHAWYDCSTHRKDWVQDFLTLCVQVGADQATLRVAQLVRMPWGIRADNGRTQKPIFYDN